jgi:phosphopantothenoylcysteine synthetase/decarboxylase
MNLLVTAGNTRVLIDRVRCLTNIFTGRTGAQIALAAHQRGHHVTLVTSHSDSVARVAEGNLPTGERWKIIPYETFDELRTRMESAIRPGGLDAVIHTAAVSDYLSAGVYAPAPGTHFASDQGCWQSSDPDQRPAMVDRRAGKVKSDEPELWLRLVRAPKLVDMIRSPWGFRGVLVKFKLEVGVSEEKLIEIAERSRLHSNANLMVANTLEGASSWAVVGPLAGKYEQIERAALPVRLMDAVEQLHREARRG